MKIYTIIEQNDKYIKLSSSNEITIIPIVDVILVDDNSGYISIKNTASRKTIGLIKKSVGPVPPTPVTELICKYNVTSTSDAIRLINNKDSVSYQIIDGVQQDTIQIYYTFDTLGEHIVKYKLKGTIIGSDAFNGINKLTSVTIPDSVTIINANAFYNCSILTSVTFPDSVTTIGNSAFAESKRLTNITIPNSVTTIGNSAFENCTSLTSVTVEATTPPTLGDNSFDNTNNCPIYVPSVSLNDYKEAPGWDNYESRIQAIQ